MTDGQQQVELLPMSVGETLATARKRRQMSVQAAARILKCDPERLRLIEADASPDLAPIYWRGFVESYARLLGLEEAQIGRLSEQVQHIEPTLETVGLQGPSLYSADRWLRAASYVLATLLVGTLAWQMAHEAVRLAQNETPSLASPQAKVEASAAPHVAASIASVDAFEAPASSRTGQAGVNAWAALEPLQDRSDSPLEDGEHWLEIRASSDSWVEITDRNGAFIEQDLLRGGDQRRYRGFAPFRISLGRSSAVDLRVDGIAIDLEPHTRDNVTQMTLNPAQRPLTDS